MTLLSLLQRKKDVQVESLRKQAYALIDTCPCGGIKDEPVGCLYVNCACGNQIRFANEQEFEYSSKQFIELCKKSKEEYRVVIEDGLGNPTDEQMRDLWKMVVRQNTGEDRHAFMCNWLRGTIKIPRDVQIRIKHANTRKTQPGLGNELEFREELCALINRHSIDAKSNTPDYILAQYLFEQLCTYAMAKSMSEAHHGDQD